MPNIVDYAVAYTNTADPASNLRGTFSVDMDTLAVTAVNITITDGTVIPPLTTALRSRIN